LFGAANLLASGFINFPHTLPAVYVSIYNHACAIFVNGRVTCWGINDKQQLGENLDNTGAHRGLATQPMAGAVMITFASTYNTIPIVAVAPGR
jgi:hypothetical protein